MRGVSSKRTPIGPPNWTPEWLSYSPVLESRPVSWLWRRTFCRVSVHLFDEVRSLDDHHLYCDACGCTITLP